MVLERFVEEVGMSKDSATQASGMAHQLVVSGEVSGLAVISTPRLLFPRPIEHGSRCTTMAACKESHRYARKVHHV